MQESAGVLIRNGQIAYGSAWQPKSALGMRNGRIVFIGRDDQADYSAYQHVLDADGCYISPGLIDCHTHGGIGLDFLTVPVGELAKLLTWYASNGVTGVMPTLSAGLKADFLAGCERLTSVSEAEISGAKILGIHIEGPYINKAKKGAQPYDEKNPVPVGAVDEYLGFFKNATRIMTLAPEIEGGLELIDKLMANRVLCSIGHSNATFAQTMQAIQHGLSRSSHTFNAQSAFSHQEPGIIGALMISDSVFAEITLDGHHVHPAAAKAFIKAKGFEKVVLITDSMQATGLGDGEFIRPGNRKIYVKNGTARLENGSLAGSVLTLNRAVANAVHLLDLPLSAAIRMASRHAAESLQLKMCGSLIAGYQADIIIHDSEMNILNTFVNGKMVYSKK